MGLEVETLKMYSAGGSTKVNCNCTCYGGRGHTTGYNLKVYTVGTRLKAPVPPF
jgi:hypothetical protein